MNLLRFHEKHVECISYLTMFYCLLLQLLYFLMAVFDIKTNTKRTKMERQILNKPQKLYIVMNCNKKNV